MPQFAALERSSRVEKSYHYGIADADDLSLTEVRESCPELYRAIAEIVEDRRDA